MKYRKYFLFIVILLLFTTTFRLIIADQYYEDEYNFQFTIDEWTQVSGYNNNSFFYTSQSLLKVISYTDDNITYLEKDSSGIYFQVYNFSLTESLPYVGPVGFDFINANQMPHYYDLWNNQENLTEAYFHIICVGYTTDERYAENFVFQANLSIYLENQVVDYIYDTHEGDVADIVDSYTLTLQIYVEYDLVGLLKELKEIVTIDGSIIQTVQITSKQRVDNFGDLELIEETSLTNLFYITFSLLILIIISNKRRKYHETLN